MQNLAPTGWRFKVQVFLPDIPESFNFDRIYEFKYRVLEQAIPPVYFLNESTKINIICTGEFSNDKENDRYRR